MVEMVKRVVLMVFGPSDRALQRFPARWCLYRAGPIE